MAKFIRTCLVTELLVSYTFVHVLSNCLDMLSRDGIDCHVTVCIVTSGLSSFQLLKLFAHSSSFTKLPTLHYSYMTVLLASSISMATTVTVEQVLQALHAFFSPTGGSKKDAGAWLENFQKLVCQHVLVCTLTFTAFDRYLFSPQHGTSRISCCGQIPCQWK